MALLIPVAKACTSRLSTASRLLAALSNDTMTAIFLRIILKTNSTLSSTMGKRTEGMPCLIKTVE